jgi:hypothetical protein
MVMPIRRLLLLWLTAALVCCVTLRFCFPGYLDPFVPFHLDHFSYIGMHVKGYGFGRYFLKYPRPVAHVLIDLCGRLGIHGLLVPLFLLTWLNAALLVLFIERVVAFRVAWLSFVFFLAIAYANPEFYWNVKQDPFSVFAFTFLICTFHAWQSYVETGKRWYLAVILALALLFSFTKESYFLALGLFFLVQRRWAAVAMLAACVAFMGLALFRSSQVWVLAHSATTVTDPYYTSFAGGSVWHGFLKIGKYLAVPAASGAVVLTLIQAARIDRRIFAVSLVAVMMGIASLLPNATLPNHLEAQYCFLGAYFFLTPVLFADRLIPHWWADGVIVFALALVSYQKPLHEVAGWLREQEQITRRMLPELERIQRETKLGEHSLVTGATMFYNPFLGPEFILYEFGGERLWTVVVPDSVAEGQQDTVQLMHAPDVARSGFYDHIFEFSANGGLHK